MRVLKLWIIVGILAGAVIALLAITETLSGDELPRVSWMTFGALLVLAVAHMSIDMLRGAPAERRDDSDQPVP